MVFFNNRDLFRCRPCGIVNSHGALVRILCTVGRTQDHVVGIRVHAGTKRLLSARLCHEGIRTNIMLVLWTGAHVRTKSVPAGAYGPPCEQVAGWCSRREGMRGCGRSPCTTPSPDPLPPPTQLQEKSGTTSALALDVVWKLEPGRSRTNRPGIASIINLWSPVAAAHLPGIQ
eukprot:gene8065-biopygen22590